MPKLHLHSDVRVDLEFRNAYGQLEKSLQLVQNVIGSKGPQGDPGATTILSIKSIVLQTEIPKILGVIPAYSFIIDVYGQLITKFSDTNITHTYEVFDELGTIISTSTAETGPTRIFPLAATYTTPAVFIGAISKVARTISFRCPTAQTTGSRPGVFLVCLNYIHMPELSTLSF